VVKKKEEGNTCFKSKDFQGAFDKYTEALEEAKYNRQIKAVLYCNRAQALLKMDKQSDAMKDYTASCEANPKYVKPYIKRGQCYEKLQLWDQAAWQYGKVKEIDPRTPLFLTLRLSQPLLYHKALPEEVR
jgi:tetratricopeptide (TPR) repeat protein